MPEEVAGSVKTFVVDKDPSEIGAIMRVFPSVQIQLCVFHVSKTFKERGSKESPEVKEMLKKLRETDSEGEFFSNWWRS